MYPTQVVKKFHLNKKNFYVKKLGAARSNILIHTIRIARSNNTHANYHHFYCCRIAL